MPRSLALEGCNVLSGRVEMVMFLGAVVRLRVEVGGLLFSADLFNERNITPPRVGEQIEISFPVHACWLI